VNSGIGIAAPPTVAVNFGQVNGVPHLFLANFTGLVPGKIAIPTAVSGSKVTIPPAWEILSPILPFLGQTQILHGTLHGAAMQLSCPPSNGARSLGSVGK